VRWKVFADGFERLPEIDQIFKDSQNFLASNNTAAFATLPGNVAKLGLQVVYVPIKIDGQPDGYIAGVFDLTALPGFFADSKIFTGDNVGILSGGTKLFERAVESRSPVNTYGAESSFAILNKAFTVKIWPTNALLTQQQSSVPFYILIAGSLFSLLTAALSYFGGVSALRARRLNESEIRHRAAVENAVDGMITVDDRGIIQNFNPACERLFDYKAGEAIGNNVSALVPDSRLIWHNGILKNNHATPKKSLSYIGHEAKGTRKNGTLFPIEITVSELNLSGKVLYSGIIRDITERKEVERVKNEFISVVSHELRTPLTSIRGSLGLIVASLSNDLPDKVKVLVNIAHKNCERLILIVNDILDIEKITSGEMRFDLKRESVAALTHQAVEANAAYAQKFSTRFEIGFIDEEIDIEVDCNRYIQVLSNLLSNAAKFSPENEVIKIFATVSNGRVRIFIKDRGPGIPEEFRARIFD
jgi:PAS domain S-box-containing protein